MQKYRLKAGEIEAKDTPQGYKIYKCEGWSWFVSASMFEDLFEPIPDEEPGPESEWEPYAYSVFAMKPTATVCQGIGVLHARSAAEAYGLAYASCLGQYPEPTHFSHKVMIAKVYPEDK